MINSILLMISQYGKNKKISNIFKILWLFYVAISQIINFNLPFFLVNLSTFIMVTGITKFVCEFNRRFYSVMSILSILFYSIFIDSICYFVLPEWVPRGLTLFGYILSGISFNLKYTFLNLVLYFAFVLVSKSYVKSNIIKNTAVLNRTVVFFDLIK